MTSTCNLWSSMWKPSPQIRTEQRRRTKDELKSSIRNALGNLPRENPGRPALSIYGWNDPYRSALNNYIAKVESRFKPHAFLENEYRIAAKDYLGVLMIPNLDINHQDHFPFVDQDRFSSVLKQSMDFTHRNKNLHIAIQIILACIIATLITVVALHLALGVSSLLLAFFSFVEIAALLYFHNDQSRNKTIRAVNEIDRMMNEYQRAPTVSLKHDGDRAETSDESDMETENEGFVSRCLCLPGVA